MLKPTEEEAESATSLAFRNFDVENLNMAAVVIFRGQCNALELLGWNDDFEMWEGVENGRHRFAYTGDVADMVIARKLVCLMCGKGPAVHPGQDPPGFDPEAFAEMWLPRLKEAGLLRS